MLMIRATLTTLGWRRLCFTCTTMTARSLATSLFLLATTLARFVSSFGCDLQRCSRALTAFVGLQAKWVAITPQMDLYADHAKFIERVASQLRKKYGR
eukprot:m.115867 g.115867  ORF g.115867 m.115867 type:complete len:98 (-) comp9486_c0_seq12:1368-1661(-)